MAFRFVDSVTNRVSETDTNGAVNSSLKDADGRDMAPERDEVYVFP